MTAWATRWQRWDDRLSPIVIKELRQAVRSRQALGLVALFLIVQLLLFSGWVIVQPPDNLEMGRDLFRMLSFALVVVLVIGVPLYAGGRMLYECLNEQIDELRLPGLSFVRIFWGKTWSAMMIDLMVLSTMAPFAYACTLMRGIDLPTIAMILFINTIFSWAGIMSLLAIGCVIRSIPEGIGWGIFTLFGMLLTLGIVVIYNQAAIKGGLAGAGLGAFALVFMPGSIYATTITLLYFRAKQVRVGTVYRYSPAMSPRTVVPSAPPPRSSSTTDTAS